MGVSIRRFSASVCTAVVLLAAPTPAHAQVATQEHLSLLLQQIAELTQLVVLLQTQLIALQTQEAAEPVQAPEVGEITLPITVFTMQSAYDVLHARSSEAYIHSLFNVVNERFWKQADIAWEVADVQSHTVTSGADREYVQAALSGNEGQALFYLHTIAEELAIPETFVVAIMHSLADINPNGFYYDNGVALVSETNGRRGGTNYISYLIAHELGHALSLEHEGTVYNLMHRGSDTNSIPREQRTVLLEEQIIQARDQAQKGVPYEGHWHH